MPDLDSSTLFAIAAVLALGALAAIVRSRRKRRPASAELADGARERERRARELGWAYDETAVRGTVFTFRGENDGVKWKVRYRVDASKPERPPVLTWASRSVQGAATELRLIGRARHEKTQTERSIEKFSSLILDARDIAAAQARAQFAERTPPAEVGSEAFRERFVLIARNDRLARALIDPKVESLLMTWPGHSDAKPEDVLSAWLDWQGLRVDLIAPWIAMSDIEQLVQIGLAFAKAYRRHSAAPGVTRWMHQSRPGHVT